MIKTLKSISQLESITEKNVENEYVKFKGKIENLSEDGIQYSDIAKFVFDTSEENIEYFLKNMKELKIYSKSKNDSKTKQAINKITNHIELERCRLNHLEDMQKKQLLNMLSGTVTDVKTMSEQIKEHEDNIQEYKKEINNWYASIMTILGLFAAIVVTFFGGLGSITSIFENINGTSKYRLVFLIIIIIFAMFNIIFMLLYYISIITNKSIHKECYNGCKKINKQNNSNERNRQKSRINNKRTLNSDFKNCEFKNIKCSMRRYPFIFWFNVFLVLMMIGIIGMYYLEI